MRHRWHFVLPSSLPVLLRAAEQYPADRGLKLYRLENQSDRLSADRIALRVGFEYTLPNGDSEFGNRVFQILCS